MKKYKGKTIMSEKTNIKENVYFKESIYFKWEIYKWHYALDKESAEILRNTPFYKKWIILISKI